MKDETRARRDACRFLRSIVPRELAALLYDSHLSSRPPRSIASPEHHLHEDDQAVQHDQRHCDGSRGGARGGRKVRDDDDDDDDDDDEARAGRGRARGEGRTRRRDDALRMYDVAVINPMSCPLGDVLLT